jgi:hypothetical protein
VPGVFVYFISSIFPFSLLTFPFIFPSHFSLFPSLIGGPIFAPLQPPAHTLKTNMTSRALNEIEKPFIIECPHYHFNGQPPRAAILELYQEIRNFSSLLISFSELRIWHS